ncbi:hypothetical protein AD944_03070 [Acetobacter tropicalis]|nr:hypothetical protein AD944_03070 [Acetobacter tropicalis]
MSPLQKRLPLVEPFGQGICITPVWGKQERMIGMLRDNRIRAMSSEQRIAWLSRNARYNKKKDILEMWSIITWSWREVTLKTIGLVYPAEVRGATVAWKSWDNVREIAARYPYDSNKKGDMPVYSNPVRQEWIERSRRIGHKSGKLEIWHIIFGCWVPVNLETLAANYSVAYWHSIGLERAWIELQSGDIEIEKEEMSFDESVRLVSEKLFGKGSDVAANYEERIYVLNEDVNLPEELKNDNLPNKKLDFMTRLPERIPSCLEHWAAAQTAPVTSRLVTEDLLGCAWPLSTSQMRALANTMRQAGWELTRKASIRFWLKVDQK